MDKLFDRKRTITTEKGDELVELGVPCVNINKINANSILRVSQDQKGRIDRFTQLNVSKDANAIDTVMYFNHIFNPFSIDEGDLLYTPLYNERIFSPVGEPVLPDGTKHSSNSNGEKELTYAEKVEKAARTGLGIR